MQVAVSLSSTQFHGYFTSSFLEHVFPFSLLFFACSAPRKYAVGSGVQKSVCSLEVASTAHIAPAEGEGVGSCAWGRNMG